MGRYETDYNDLVDMHEELVGLVEECKNNLRALCLASGDKTAYEIAKATWLGEIERALGGNHARPYGGQTMGDTLAVLAPCEDDEDEEEEQDE